MKKSTFLIHYGFKRSFFKLFDSYGEGTMEIDIDNHDTDSLSSDDLSNIEEIIKKVTKGYQANVISFNKLSS